VVVNDTIHNIMDVNKKKQEIINVGWETIDYLLDIAKEKVITGDKEEDLSADKLKNAAAMYKLVITDAFDIVNRISEEQDMLEGKVKEDEPKKKNRKGFAERMANVGD